VSDKIEIFRFVVIYNEVSDGVEGHAMQFSDSELFCFELYREVLSGEGED
jgi:hypothetical protein